MCPTSLFPIWPSGRPTCIPSVYKSLWEKFSYKLSIKGVRAKSTADTAGLGAFPQPSRIIKRVFFDIKMVLCKDTKWGDNLGRIAYSKLSLSSIICLHCTKELFIGQREAGTGLKAAQVNFTIAASKVNFD